MHFKKNWLKWRDIILDDRNLSHGAKSMAMFLNTYMNSQNDMAWPGLETIAGRLSISKKTAIKYIDELEEKEYLSRHKRFSATCKYSIEYPRSVISTLLEDLHHRSVNSTTPELKDLQPNNQENNQTNKQGAKTSFSPPSLEELTSYMKEAGLNFDAETFLDYHQSKGWLVGKSKMKDWRAAARNWARRQAEFGVGQGKPALPRNDDSLPAFAEQHGLSKPNSGESYPQYRNRLNFELDKQNNL